MLRRLIGDLLGEEFVMPDQEKQERKRTRDNLEFTHNEKKGSKFAIIMTFNISKCTVDV